MVNVNPQSLRVSSLTGVEAGSVSPAAFFFFASVTEQFCQCLGIIHIYVHMYIYTHIHIYV
jgi:hypothetical protein